MKISILSKADETGGGASRVAAELSNFLTNTRGISTKQFAATSNKRYIDIRGRGVKRYVYRASQKISRLIGFPDIFGSEYLNIKNTSLHRSDIFHIHDISSAISPITLKKLSKIAPVVWTIHDCSPFTGGCIYPIECTKYINNMCSNCPQLHEWPLTANLDFTGLIQSIKIDIINNNIKKVICPSQWIAKLAMAAGISESLISIIYNSVDVDLFQPKQNKNNAKLCILLSSVDLNNRFKGSEFALKIINKLKFDADILVIGKNGSHLKEKIDPQHTVCLVDQTFDQKVLASYYRKADLLLHTSIADNCPLTVLEALSSGVPVITFNTGGIPELIRHNMDGWISEIGDIDSSVDIIEYLQKNNQILNNWKINCREAAMKRFDNKFFLEKHIELYRELIESRNN